MVFYGKIGFPRFGKRIEQDFDYDVFFVTLMMKKHLLQI